MSRLVATLALSLVAMMLVACASTTDLGYSGPRRSADAVATVSGSNAYGRLSGVNLQITAVDGRALDLASRLPNVVEVLPGRHAFELGLSTGGQSTWTVVEVDVVAGDRLEFAFTAQRPGFAGNLEYADTHVRDLASGERRLAFAGWKPTERIDTIEVTSHHYR